MNQLIKPHYMKFTKGKGSDFYHHLNVHVEAYFRNRRRSKFGSSEILFKGILLMLLYAGSYSCIYFFDDRTDILIPAYIMIGLSGVMIVFNIVHDASHHALSSS